MIKEGDPKNVGFVVPTEKNSAVYGMLTSLTITAGQKTEETEAAEKFVTFMAVSYTHLSGKLYCPTSLNLVLFQQRAELMIG